MMAYVKKAQLILTTEQLVQWNFLKEILSAVLDEDTEELME